MADVETAMQNQGATPLPTLHSVNTPLFDLAYADDTALIGKSWGTVQRALHHIESIASQYNLKLNKSKCIHLRQNSPHFIRFTDGTPTKHQHQAKYLGVVIRDDCSTLTDITSRIGKARAGFQTLHKFWRHTDISISYKLKIYRAVFIPMLTYGMESAALTQSQFNRLNAFHTQCVRKIHNIKSTYFTEVLDTTYDTTTNLETLQLAHINSLQAIINRQRLKYLGHVYRCQPSDLEREVVFTGVFVYRARGGKQRKGRRKCHWVEQVSQQAWGNVQDILSIQPPQPFTAPSTYHDLSRHASNRIFWHKVKDLPTCRELA